MPLCKKRKVALLSGILAGPNALRWKEEGILFFFKKFSLND